MRCNICGWVNPNGVSQCQKCGHTLHDNIRENHANCLSKDYSTKHPENFSEADLEKESAIGFLILAGILAAFGGLFGSIIGFTIYYAKDLLIDPVTHKKIKMIKYKESHRIAGLIIAIIGIISWILWSLYLYS